MSEPMSRVPPPPPPFRREESPASYGEAFDWAFAATLVLCLLAILFSAGFALAYGCAL